MFSKIKLVAIAGFIAPLLGFSGVAHASGVFLSSYSAVVTFTDGGPGTTMPLAFDGTNYYSGNGGGLSSPYVQYDSSGAFIASAVPSPGIDFRSVFTDGAGNLYARGFGSAIIYQQTSFGSFTPYLTLSGGSLDAQSAVVPDIGGTGYVANAYGTVSRWDAAGNFIGTVTLAGFGGTEGIYPQGRGIAVDANEWLTYDIATQVLSAWDTSGNRIGTTTLIGAGTDFDSGFSYSFANGLFFVADANGGTWRGYDIAQINATPIPATLPLFAGGLGTFGLLGWRRKRKAKSAA